MPKSRKFLLFIAAGLLAVPLLLPRQGISERFDTFPAPEFTQASDEAWINSVPLDRSVFEGKVTLLDFWTFECWNCYRSFPWLHGVEKRFADREDFQVIGIHTPEFKHERDRDNVVAKVAEFEIAHPVMLDNDFAYWKAMQNRYWPAWYLVDQKGIVQHRFIGEMHADTPRAQVVEQAIESLLNN